MAAASQPTGGNSYTVLRQGTMQQAHLQNCMADVLQCLLYSLVVGRAALQGQLPPRQLAQPLRRLRHMQLGRAAGAGGNGSNPTCSSTDLFGGLHTHAEHHTVPRVSWQGLQGGDPCSGLQPLQPGTTLHHSHKSAVCLSSNTLSCADQTAHQLTALQKTKTRPLSTRHPAAALSRW